MCLEVIDLKGLAEWGHLVLAKGRMCKKVGFYGAPVRSCPWFGTDRAS